MTAYYNEIDAYAADWLRNLIKEGLIADGEVDTRSIVDVRPDDLSGFEQCHFFAGIGGWSYALRLAGWPDDRAVWTGSCPCQPFSLAGAQKGFADERHLWPIWRELIRERRPAKIFGEQVASATEWLRLVRGDLEAMGYAVGAMPIQAASAGADHLRDRYWFVADADYAGLQGRRLLPECASERPAGADGVAYADQSGTREKRQQRSRQQCGAGCNPEPCARDVGFADRGGRTPGQPATAATRYRGAAIPTGGDSDMGHTEGDGQWRPRIAGPSGGPQISVGGHGPHEWVIGADGKARRVKPGIRLLAHGIPNRVGLLRGFGNAIDPRCAAEFIGAAMTDCTLTSHEGKST